MKSPYWHSRSGTPDIGDPVWSSNFFEVWQGVSYKDGYGLLLAKDQKDAEGRWYFQVEADRLDAMSGKPGLGRGGKAYLSPHMSVSELTRLVFDLFRSYEEHECREFFKWRGRAIFGPHISSEALWQAATELDFRRQQ